MRKRSSYRPRGVNPSAHLVAMMGAARMSVDDVLQRAGALRLAVDAACRGRGTKADWMLVFDAVNMAEQWMRAGLVAGQESIEELQAHILAALDRKRLKGTTGLTSDERVALDAFAADYASILSGVSQREYFEAQRAVETRVRRVLAGESIPAGVHIVEAA